MPVFGDKYKMTMQKHMVMEFQLNNENLQLQITEMNAGLERNVELA